MNAIVRGDSPTSNAQIVVGPYAILIGDSTLPNVTFSDVTIRGASAPQIGIRHAVSAGSVHTLEFSRVSFLDNLGDNGPAFTLSGNYVSLSFEVRRIRVDLKARY